MIRLFTSKTGVELTNVNFVHVWKTLMAKYAKGQVSYVVRPHTCLPPLD